MGYLKGCFQSLKGLQQQIKNQTDHLRAVEWIRACIVIHTLIHEIEYGNEDERKRLLQLGCHLMMITMLLQKFVMNLLDSGRSAELKKIYFVLLTKSVSIPAELEGS